MKVNEILSELSFHGRKCTKDCSGHSAGYKWAMQKQATQPCASNNTSFNNGCEIAADQIANNKVVRPKVRDERGKFAKNPTLPKPSTKFNKSV